MNADGSWFVRADGKGNPEKPKQVPQSVPPAPPAEPQQVIAPPVFVQQTVAFAGPPHCCRYCGGPLRREKEAQGEAGGCALAFFGFLSLVLFFWTIVIPFVGAFVMLYGLNQMMKRKGIYRCKQCEATFPRRIRWYELG